MFDRIIRFSITNRWFVMMATAAVALLGFFNYERLPIDAVPDITNVQVQINAEAPGYTPLEVEQQITFPLETALAGLPSLSYTRSLSRYGLSQTTVVFEDGTDIYFARQLIGEKLLEAKEKLPAGIVPALGPIATGLGEIFLYTVENSPERPDSERLSPMELRTVHDWIVKPQLRTVPGAVEVNTIGGFEKQFHIYPRLERLLGLGLTMQDLATAVESNNANVGAGYLERSGAQYLVRVPGRVKSIEEIESLIVANREGKPIFIRDVAEVGLGSELRTGAATDNGEEVVLGTVFMLMGENSRVVSQRAGKKLEEINRSLPEGVIVKPVYDRTTLVDNTIDTVTDNLLEGATLVILVLFLFLGNFRAALVTAMVIPLSMLFTVSGMVSGRLSANLMSLGALDFGLIVDGSVIIVENCIRRLGEAQAALGRRLSLSERLELVHEAALEVRQSTMFGELIIIVVYLPILALSGIEGKMFHPMALTVIVALVGAMIFSITFVPAAVAIFVPEAKRDEKRRLMGPLEAAYGRLMAFSLKMPRVTVLAAVGVFAASLLLSGRLGTEFIPQLDEGDVALHALRIPGTSLSQAVAMQKALEKRLREIPEVSHTFSRIGTADIANDPMPPNVSDVFVMMKERGEWPDPGKSKAQLVSEIEKVVSEVPGNNYEFTQPIEMRFNELIAGVRSDVAIKLFGDDLGVLSRSGEELADALGKVAGASDVRVEQITGLPMLSVDIDRAKLSKFGVNMREVQEAVQTAIAGKVSGELFDGDRRFPIVVRLPEKIRADIDALGSLPILLPERRHGDTSFKHATLGHDDPELRSFVPLSSVAQITLALGPNQISRENGKRRVVVSANVRGRDLGGFVEEAEKAIEQVELPAGYWAVWGGQFEHLISAKQRLQIVVPAALGLILMLLYSTFGRMAHALLVFTGVPLALSGGIFALWLRGIPLSVSAMIGFIALSGVAVLNGLVMLSFIRSLRKDGMEPMEAISRGAMIRLRPILMTALVASLGFLPMAIATGPGAEVQRPLATVVIGGIASATFLTLFVLPALYLLFGRWLKEE